MFHIALFQPEIPPNTGNIIRLSANIGARLHLIYPLGFALDDKQLRRAGLDYHEWADVHEYPHYSDFLTRRPQGRLFACSTKGHTGYHQVEFKEHDTFLFGPETRGLPMEILSNFEPADIIYIPMLPNNRSLNLSNAVAVILYEAWRQQGFLGSLR